jgi:hypothetical protein
MVSHFRAQFAEEHNAKKAATDVLAVYPMLQIEIYDASAKSRSSVTQAKFCPAASN